MLPFSPSLLPPALRDPRVLEAIAALPRERFVPEAARAQANRDEALPIGFGQTISQPLLVAYMTASLALPAPARVLEVGTGSGYQTAVLARLGHEVFSVEIIPELAARARATLAALGLDARVRFRVGDGRHGWPGEAPFDGVLCAAASPIVPPAFLEQVRPGGRLVLPLGRGDEQTLVTLVRTAAGVERLASLPVRFVPLVRGAPRG